MKRKIASTIIQLTIGPSKNFLSQIETRWVSSYMAYAISELVPTWLRVPIWSGTDMFWIGSIRFKSNLVSSRRQ